ncbi:AbrB family transcriptional regulator [Rhodoferax mekongensis]|uniref:AbrB family transcriptional regulator n=1 Tax=Rhodoferax mekongensis TaxID=3068341 RepID=A0ABZ0AXL3_9BURK|nr:AbrB family transcriptional regulator [Rhodoferax sp. TBRC 17307]WNO04182.1 AbrB family transcriptional regulator [Rhodoferax sp. TBRC 17307]
MSFFRLQPRLHGPALLLCSALASAAFLLMGVPAGMLLGCMLAAVLLATQDMNVRVPAPLFAIGQSVIACLMARSLHFEVLHRVAGEWPLFLGIAFSVMAASALLGFWLMRSGLLPGSTAIWGLAPGAASAMVLMAGDFGADTRLVAFMQYLRVALVTAIASLVAHFAAGASLGQTAAGWDVQLAHWLHIQNPLHAGLTLALVLAAAGLGRTLAFPGGPLLIPMVLALAMDNFSPWKLELPGPLLALAYAALGWGIGLRFNRAILEHAWRVLPRVLVAIAALIVLGLLIAGCLMGFAGVAPLTAYLSTSPGGADSVAVIAVGSAVDAGFVMAMQMVRFFMVLLLGPRLSRWLVQRLSARTAA